MAAMTRGFQTRDREMAVAGVLPILWMLAVAEFNAAAATTTSAPAPRALPLHRRRCAVGDQLRHGGFRQFFVSNPATRRRPEARPSAAAARRDRKRRAGGRCHVAASFAIHDVRSLARTLGSRIPTVSRQPMHAHQTGTDAIRRLESDLRTFSPAGIERVAWGWRQHEAQPERIHAAERAALHEIERTGRGQEWEDLRATLSRPHGGPAVALVLERGAWSRGPHRRTCRLRRWARALRRRSTVGGAVRRPGAPAC